MLCCSRSVALVSLGGLFAALLVSATLPTPAPAAARAAAEQFEVDSIHSSVVFRIKHMGVSYFHGRFNQIEGQFTLDADKPENSSVEVSIAAESVDTNSGKRDDHVRSPDFLNASEFPQITFKSEKVKAAKDGHFEVSGQLTLHGETRPLTVQVEQTGTGKAMRGDGKLTGFETTFTIKRSDFGMKEMLDSLGDEVRLTVAVEGHSK